MNKQVYLFCKGNVTAIPPVYNYAMSLAGQGYSVNLICGEINTSTKSYLTSFSSNIHIDDLNLGSYSRIKKIYFFRKIINQKYFGIVDQQIWFCTFDTAIALYKSKLYSSNKFILSVLELYDSAGFYTKFFLRKIVKHADKIVVPEYNRACILKVFYNLKNLPFVIPNKPYSIQLPSIDQNLQEKMDHLIQFAKGRRIILYQGLLTHHRNLDLFVNVIREYDREYILLLIGPVVSDYLQHLKKLNDTNLLYLGNLDAPLHLHITRLADIGILKYDFIDLNNIYCAPNKLWEYSAFSLALLGNNVPGLKFLIEKYNAGMTIDFENESEIRTLLSNFNSNQEHYKVGSKNLYNSVDYNKLVEEVVDR